VTVNAFANACEARVWSHYAPPEPRPPRRQLTRPRVLAAAGIVALVVIVTLVSAAPKFAQYLPFNGYTNTKPTGSWQADFKIPKYTVSKYANTATVTFQVWKGNLTRKSFTRFVVTK